VPKMVELSGKTAEHLSRSMKKYYNVSPTDYINNLRMKNVSRLLLETDNPVVDICYENGYQNMSWFNTLFKKTFFMTPSQFREKFKNNVK
ncbi:MAG: helix-turn-helix transcriptional regulator, partial [Acutalibacteraceae bacterium]